jgi:hypothetical protein
VRRLIRQYAAACRLIEQLGDFSPIKFFRQTSRPAWPNAEHRQGRPIKDKPIYCKHAVYLTSGDIVDNTGARFTNIQETFLTRILNAILNRLRIDS